MRKFITETLDDIQNGRESWRVIVATAVPALAVSIVLQLLLQY